MADIADTLTALAARLSEAGVRSVIDARDLNPPGCLVAAPVFRWTFGGRLAVDYRLVVVVPSAGAAQELKLLGSMMDAVAAILGGEVLTAVPTAFAPVGGGDPLPAYELTWTSKTTKPAARG